MDIIHWDIESLNKFKRLCYESQKKKSIIIYYKNKWKIMNNMKTVLKVRSNRCETEFYEQKLDKYGISNRNYHNFITSTITMFKNVSSVYIAFKNVNQLLLFKSTLKSYRFLK